MFEFIFLTSVLPNDDQYKNDWVQYQFVGINKKFLVLMEFVVLTKMRQNWLKLDQENCQNASTTVYQRKGHHYKPYKT
ncbi:MAG: hypothetical protein NTW32_07070, partial [Chloroflexi bacterium]|nr:hypothetical protein [Chloroflexota bacterium]